MSAAETKPAPDWWCAHHGEMGADTDPQPWCHGCAEQGVTTAPAPSVPAPFAAGDPVAWIHPHNGQRLIGHYLQPHPTAAGLHTVEQTDGWHTNVPERDLRPAAIESVRTPTGWQHRPAGRENPADLAESRTR